MPRPHLLLGLLAAVLLSLGNAGVRNAHAVSAEAMERAEMVTAATDIIGAALPAPFVSVAPQAELDPRRVHPAPRPTRDPGRSVAPLRDRRSSSASHAPRGEYAAARLLRGGIDSSSLGTPPPQS